MKRRIQTEEEFLAYMRGLHARQFSGHLAIYWEAGNIVWIYEKPSGVGTDGTLIRTSEAA
jgi:hypothetical protein